MSFSVDGATAVSSFVMCSKIHWDMIVPLDNTALTYKILRMFTSHFMTFWKEVSRNPLASLPVKLGWKGTSVQWKRSAPTVMMFAGNT